MPSIGLNFSRAWGLWEVYTTTGDPAYGETFAAHVLASYARRSDWAGDYDTVAHWVELLNRGGVPAGPVYSVPQMFEDAQVRHIGVVTSTRAIDGRELRLISQPVKLQRTPAQVVAAAPDIGQHSEEVLREAGYGDEDIARLRQLQVI